MGKKKKVQNEEEMENYFDVFMRNYRNVPGFRSLVKLIMYFIFILIFVIVVMLANGNTDVEEDNNPTTTTSKIVENNKTYKEILDTLVNCEKLTYDMNISVQEENYLITASSSLGEIIGYFENDENTKRFKISNNKIYELKLDNSFENKELFENVDVDFVITANLVNLLKNNLSTKRILEDYSIYTYSINYHNIDYKMNVYVNSERVLKIEINSDKINYLINYKEVL